MKILGIVVLCIIICIIALVAVLDHKNRNKGNNTYYCPCCGSYGQELF